MAQAFLMFWICRFSFSVILSRFMYVCILCICITACCKIEMFKLYLGGSLEMLKKSFEFVKMKMVQLELPT